MNIKNFGTVIGRLTKEPVVFSNSDGSRKVMLTVATQDNFKNAGGERGTQFVNLEAFVSNLTPGLGVYDSMHKGDMGGIGFTVKSNSYEKNGETVYSQVLQVTDVDLMESKTAQERRAAIAANAAAVAPKDAPAPAPKTNGRGRKKKAAESDEVLPFSEG